MQLLAIEKLTKSFGGLTAVLNVNIELQQGELIGLIGPNGAGKTTVFNLLTGVYVPTSGNITFCKDDSKISLHGLRPQKYVKKVARTFQNIRLFRI